MVNVCPFKCKNVRVVVDDSVLSVVELTNITLYKKGGVEPSYGMKGKHSDRRHVIGKKSGRFTIRRWFKAGTSTSLFNYLHDNDLLFDIEEYLNGVFEDGDFIGIRLLNCESYNYKYITGSPNDIIGEEINGEFTSWEKITYEEDEDVPIEGDYSGYTLLWKRSTTIDGALIEKPRRFYVNEVVDSIQLICQIRFRFGFVKLSDGTDIVGESGADLNDDRQATSLASSLVKYTAVVIDTDVPTLFIWKEGVLLQEIDLNAVCGWTELDHYYNVAFTADGKYIYVSETNTANEFALFVGS